MGNQGDGPRETKSRANLPHPEANYATTGLRLSRGVTLRRVQSQRRLPLRPGRAWGAKCWQARAESPEAGEKVAQIQKSLRSSPGSGQWRAGEQTLKGGRTRPAGSAATA